MRTQRDREIRDLAEAYRMSVDDATPEQNKALRQEQRKAEAAIVKAYQPEEFGVWLHRHRQNERDQAQRVSELEQLRVAKQKQAVARTASVEIEFDDELEEEQEQTRPRRRASAGPARHSRADYNSSMAADEIEQLHLGAF